MNKNRPETSFGDFDNFAPPQDSSNEKKREKTKSADLAVENITEQKEVRIPPLVVDFFFGIHGSSEDAKGLEKSFESTDIYIPERHGWNDLTISHLQDLSFGRISPDELITEAGIKNHPMIGFLRQEMDMIYKSYKPILILDVPTGHPKSKAWDESYKANTNESPVRQSFYRKLQEIKTGIRKEADFHNEREDYMLSQLYPKIKEVLAARPDLANKQDLKVLMFLGAAHTRISHLMAKFGQKTSRTFSRPLIRFPFSTEAQRRLSLGKEIDNELAAKVLLEGLAQTLVGSLAEYFTADTTKIFAFTRKIVDRFTLEEIEALYNLPLSEAVQMFVQDLEKKGFTPPRNLDEFEKFISTNN